jgi:hypothetical protein
MPHPLPAMDDAEMVRLIHGLDSLIDGDLAVAMLIACGERSVPYLEHFLLTGAPRTIALPRCRAVRALGELGAYSTLLSYFREYVPPEDAQVMFAEDAVRSAVARELLRWKSDEVFNVLIEAVRQRPTSGLILAVGEFCRPDTVPVLFHVLEDDLCRQEAKDGLRKVPAAAHQYAILTIRGKTDTELHGAAALRRLRATLQLLDESGVSPAEWPDIRPYLDHPDADVVIAAANIGSKTAPEDEQKHILESLFRIANHINWAQEDDMTQLLDKNKELAREVAWKVTAEQRIQGQRPNWLTPLWRLLRHVLGRELEKDHSGAA